MKGDNYYWKQGEGILFNDTYLHSVNNNTAGYRIVLFLDIKKPSSFITRQINQLMLKIIQLSPELKKARETGKIITG